MIRQPALRPAGDTSERHPLNHFGAQHALFAGSLLILAVTGLPQRFDSLAVSEWVVDAVGGIENLRTVHHLAAAALIAASVYYVAAVAKTVLVDRDLRALSMLPDGRDFSAAMRLAGHLLGLRGYRPAAPRRPGYLEKFDYWVLAWGALVMAASGLMRLFPVRAADLLSTALVEAALRAHSNLGPLLAVWFIVLHLGYLRLVCRDEPAPHGAIVPEALEAGSGERGESGA